MSSGNDWTHHWILNMSPSQDELDKGVNSNVNNLYFEDSTFPVEDPLGVNISHDPDENISISPVNSSDLERDSPMACGIEDDEEAGPPSIETQNPEQNEDLEIAQITSSWINSGGHYGNSLHPGLGYETGQDILPEVLSLDYYDNGIISLPSGLADSSQQSQPFIGPSLPMAPCTSPVQGNSPLTFGDIADDNAFSGLCGLRNLGNTCFMAAGIQCLVNTPPIAQYFFNHHLDSEEDHATLAGRFSQLTHKMWSGKYSCLRPAEFKEAFSQQWRDFRDYRQHDCQEFMTLLLEALKKQMPIDESEQIDVVGSFSAPQSPRSTSSIGVESIKHQSDNRSDIQEDTIGLDSGTASPKSSISSSSVDAHLISLRLQPIPEEIRRKEYNLQKEQICSTSKAMSCCDSDGAPSEMSDSWDASCMGGSVLRRYNQFSTNDNCDYSKSENDDLSLEGKNWSHILDKNYTCDKSHLSLVNLEDIMKETKTSNVNVLIKDNKANNEILYDSEKYATKGESKKLKNSLDNLSKPVSNVKRVKEVNLLVDKMDNSQIMENSSMNLSMSPKPSCSNAESVNVLRQKTRTGEKNVQYEIEKTQNDSLDAASTEKRITSESLKEHQMAKESWKSYVGEGKSAVVDTFYGQFKSSLVCLTCGHTSIRFDPFGTLSVPLPFANEIQIAVTFVPHDSFDATRILLTLSKMSSVADLKQRMLNVLKVTTNEVVLSEVFDNHIARIVEDSHLIKFLNHSVRNIYGFELSPPPSFKEIEESTENEKTENVPSTSSMTYEAEWQACNICLEELCQTDLKTHQGCEDCILCENCVEMSCKHHKGDSLPCPVCHTLLYPAELIPVAKKKTEKPKARILRVPVVFRVDTESDDNNKRESSLIGHPILLCLPSQIKFSKLFEIIENKLIKEVQFSLLLVDGRGYNCSRCLFSSHCRGCNISKVEDQLHLQAGDTLCVRFTSISFQQKAQLSSVTEHPSLNCMRKNAPLTIYDCLRAFSQSETLQESDSWFCPKCESKRQATKTISVWKFPPYLILHLERFQFHGTNSTKLDDKVIFPLDGLDLTDFVAGGDQQTPSLYNLYSCVCHMGIAQAGHYTALVRSPVTNEWHYFNDDSVTRQKFKEEEYSSSYILFYHRQGTNFDLALPQNFAFTNYASKHTVDENGICAAFSNSISEERDDDSLSGCRKKVCVENENERKALVSSSSIDNEVQNEERQRKCSSTSSRATTSSSSNPPSALVSEIISSRATTNSSSNPPSTIVSEIMAEMEANPKPAENNLLDCDISPTNLMEV